MASYESKVTSPGVWPREAPRHTGSQAEQKVYAALKASLPKGWVVWHSLGLRSREDGEFGEADYKQACYVFRERCGERSGIE